MTKNRLRITYSVDGDVRYISHLEQMQVWERAARRAALPLDYTQGFNPRPRLQAAAALPVGFAARDELLDLWLTEPVEPGIAGEALAPQLPAGLVVHRAWTADPAEPPLQAQVRAAAYRVTVETTAAIQQTVKAILEADSLPRERRGKPYDLRPLIHELWVEAHQDKDIVLGMVLAARAGATGRPEEVLDTLGLTEAFFRICRQQLFLGLDDSDA